jgi:hypothetical protein
MNRDTNSVLNMHKILRDLILNNKRPQNYQRILNQLNEKTTVYSN